VADLKGDLVWAADLSSSLGRPSGLACVGCGEPMIDRLGTKRRPHFGHRPGSTCSGGETALHRTAIGDSGFLSSIRANQTSALFAEYSKAHQGDTQNLDTIRLVLPMTPGNIHLNSFMYEPILDMSNDHLRSLFRKVQALV
jgi:hypothetical protein